MVLTVPNQYISLLQSYAATAWGEWSLRTTVPNTVRLEDLSGSAKRLHEALTPLRQALPDHPVLASVLPPVFSAEDPAGIIPCLQYFQDLSDRGLYPLGTESLPAFQSRLAAHFLQPLTETPGAVEAGCLVTEDHRGIDSTTTLVTALAQAGAEAVWPQPARRLEVQADGQTDEGRLETRTILSPYVVERLIGHGGHSRVLLAEELGPNRKVAIKVVTDRSVDRSRMMEAFAQEIAIQGNDRDEFVRCYATGLTSDGKPFIVMEYFPDGSLRQYIDAMRQGQKNFSLKEALRLATQCVASVASAHQLGIIHRDVKPENFFHHGERCLVRLGDFGIAVREQDLQTEVSGLMGTIQFSPPEAFREGLPALDRDSFARDVFALGVTLYELLTGFLPFDTRTHLIRAGKFLLEGTAEAIPPPSRVASERGLPPALDLIILKAMELNPKLRYQNAGDMLTDLLTFRAREIEERAAVVRQNRMTHAEIAIGEESWKDLMEQAWAEYDRVYQEYPLEPVRRRLLEILEKLFLVADRSGEEMAVRRWKEAILDLEPEDALTSLVNRDITFQIDLAQPLSRGIRPSLTLIEQKKAGGFLLISGSKMLPMARGEALHLERGRTYTLQFQAPGMATVAVPLPPRVGAYRLQIPIYPEDRVPRGFVVIPAGPTVVRVSGGSHTQWLPQELWRSVPHDYALGPLLTIEGFLQYLESGKIGGKRPRGYRIRKEGKDFVITNPNGLPVSPRSPLMQVLLSDGMEYLQAVYGRKARIPTLYEWLRAFRPDGREWPWGDAVPVQGASVLRHRGFFSPDVAVSIDEENLDVSPFSIRHPDNPAQFLSPIRHLVGNGRTYCCFDPGDLAGARRIFSAVGMSFPHDQAFLAALRNHVIVVGGQKIDPEVVSVESIHQTGPNRFFPVIPLERAPVMPSIEEMVQVVDLA